MTFTEAMDHVAKGFEVLGAAVLVLGHGVAHWWRRSTRTVPSRTTGRPRG